MLKEKEIWINVAIAVLSSAELYSGHISALLGPTYGPPVAAFVMLSGAVYNIYQRVKLQQGK